MIAIGYNCGKNFRASEEKALQVLAILHAENE